MRKEIDMRISSSEGFTLTPASFIGSILVGLLIVTLLNVVR